MEKELRGFLRHSTGEQRRRAMRFEVENRCSVAPVQVWLRYEQETSSRNELSAIIRPEPSIERGYAFSSEDDGRLALYGLRPAFALPQPNV